MQLNEELQAIQNGEKGETMRKILNTNIMYGQALGAERMVKITGDKGHSVVGCAPVTWKPVFALFDELVEAGLTSTVPYSADPRPFDPKVPMTTAQRLLGYYIFSSQKRLEKQYEKLGVMNDRAFTCTCYMPEVGNVPKRGDILAWAESSAVVYANSVIGARCNRNSGIIELMSDILGYVPEFGFLTDDGRKADWIIEIRCSKKPEAQILGSAIGMKVVDQVPFIRGLDRWLGTELTQGVKDYLKDMGAASASNGSVGLYHVENLTPEAVEQGAALIRPDAQVYVIDDDVLEQTHRSYPVIWKDPEAEPELCFIGCPHLGVEQIRTWTHRVEAKLAEHGNKRVTVPTVFLTAPDVAAAFREKYPKEAKAIKRMDIVLSSICPLSFTGNPLTKKTRIITCSNKFRTYSAARFYPEETLLDIITGEAKGK